jgi:hypothetical protein
MNMFVVSAVRLAAMAGPAVAQQPMMDDCAKMTAGITAEAGRRFDAASYDAKMKAANATKLCREGKKAEAEKLTKEAAASLGMKM